MAAAAAGSVSAASKPMASPRSKRATSPPRAAPIPPDRLLRGAADSIVELLSAGRSATGDGRPASS